MTMIYKKITAETWDYQRKIPMCPSKGAFEIAFNGGTYFVLNGKLHRTDGPTYIGPHGTQFYYQNGNLHRADGSAVIWDDGYEEYYLFGKQYQKEEWEPLAIQLSLKEQIV